MVQTRQADKVKRVGDNHKVSNLGTLLVRANILTEGG